MRFRIAMAWLWLTGLAFFGAAYADETDLLIPNPDAVILLDQSGSMNGNLGGDSANVWGTSASCVQVGPPGGDDTTDCSRLGIAKRTIRFILDVNSDGRIDAADEAGQRVNFGYIQFRDGAAGEIQPIGASYGSLWNALNSATAAGGTALATALDLARQKLDARKATDMANGVTCRKRYIILITDGSDTESCSGTGTECQGHMYKRRREVVRQVKLLADSGYKTFVIGLGTAMPAYLKNTLEWMAYAGGTDNPKVDNSGSTTALDLSALNMLSCKESAVADVLSGTCVDGTSPSQEIGSFYSKTNDPGLTDAARSGHTRLSGYAFLAETADDFATALSTVMNIIREGVPSFSQAAVPANRTGDENFIYEASFTSQECPFWKGHLKRFSLTDRGDIASREDYDAGSLIPSASLRNVYTAKNGSLVPFDAAGSPIHVSRDNLGVDNDAARDRIIGYMRGDPAYNPEGWKLGDIFRSELAIVKTPSLYYRDSRDTTRDARGRNAFGQFRDDHPRKTRDISGASPAGVGSRMIIAGANDGQLHAFRTSDGVEAWSVIPPNLLRKLSALEHSSHPATQTHSYFVDGPMTVWDVWLPDATRDTTGRAKVKEDWRTLLVFVEGAGARPDFLWSSGSQCDGSGMFSAAYSASTPYYCGVYALDVTAPDAPVYKWHLSPGSDAAPYFGEPWAKMAIGKIITGTGTTNYERWVGFIGGGYHPSNCSDSCMDANKPGKGFFIVDLRDGTILRKFTDADGLRCSLTATPALVDIDNDGFIDRIYIGDLCGNIWRISGCKASNLDASTNAACQLENWSINKFYEPSTNQPVFINPSVAWNSRGNLMVFWGSGDRTNPQARNSQDYFYGIQDVNSALTYTNDTKPAGSWIYRLRAGEKVLANPVVFGGVVYFTTYLPPASADLCAKAGNAYLYRLNYLDGSDKFAAMGIGTGLPSGPLISMRPAGASGNAAIGDIYLTLSGASGEGCVAGQTVHPDVRVPGHSSMSNILYWKNKSLR